MYQISNLSEVLSKEGVHHPIDLSKCAVEDLQSIAVEPLARHLLHMAMKFVMITDPFHLTW